MRERALRMLNARRAPPVLPEQALLRHDKGELRACCAAMLAVHQAAFSTQVEAGGSPYAAAKDKYRDCAWHCVSHVIPLESLPDGLFDMMA